MRIDFNKLESYRRRSRRERYDLRQAGYSAGNHLVEGLTTAAQIAGGLAALFDSVLEGSNRATSRAKSLGVFEIGGHRSREPWLSREQYQAVSFGSLAGFDLGVAEARDGAEAGRADLGAVDPSSATAQGLVPPQPPKRAGDTWAELKANYSMAEILWAYVWANYRASASNAYSALDCVNGYPAAKFVWYGADGGNLAHQRELTKAMAYWAATSYAEPVPNVWRQNKPGAAWPCDPEVCCWIDEYGSGGMPVLRSNAGDDAVAHCNADSSGTGSTGYESQCAPSKAAALAKYRACHARFPNIDVRYTPWARFIHTLNHSSLKSFNSQVWAGQCARNFPPVDPDCPWNPENDAYWNCMLVPETDFIGGVTQFFNDAWDTMKAAVSDCTVNIAEPPYKCLDWLAHHAPFPLNLIPTFILDAPKVIACFHQLIDGASLEEAADCFIAILKHVVDSVLSALGLNWETLMIAMNVAIGNIPGAVIAGAKWAASEIADNITDPDDKAWINAIIASSDLVALVMAQGLPAFRTEALWQTMGAAVQNAAPGTTAAVAGRCLARNADLVAMAVRGENITAFVKAKWLDPATALVKQAARSGAAVAADIGGDGDAFLDLYVMLSSVADILDGVGDGVNSIRILGTSGNHLKRVASNLRKAATSVQKAGLLLNQAKNVVGAALSYTPEQVEAMINDAVKKAVDAAKSDPSGTAQQIVSAGRQAVATVQVLAPATPTLAPALAPTSGTTGAPTGTPAGTPAPSGGEEPPPAPPPTPSSSSPIGPAIVGGVIGALVGGPVGAAVGAGILGAIASKG